MGVKLGQKRNRVVMLDRTLQSKLTEKIYQIFKIDLVARAEGSLWGNGLARNWLSTRAAHVVRCKRALSRTDDCFCLLLPRSYLEAFERFD